MEGVVLELARLGEKGNLGKSITDVQETIAFLTEARDSIAKDPTTGAFKLAKLQNLAKPSFEHTTSSLKEVYKSLNNYTKAVDKKFKDKATPTAASDALDSQTLLVDRAVGMHFLREGRFSIASTFVKEVSNAHGDSMDKDQRLGMGPMKSEVLQAEFAKMYHILKEMKTYKNLLPAMTWAREASVRLEARGSNLEFELGKLQFVWLYKGQGNLGKSLQERQQSALLYARTEFGRFQARYLNEIQQLIGAIAFSPNLQKSPYRRTFSHDDAWDELALSFTRDFCSLLGLSADSPIYIATTAGAIALPTLQKLQQIMETKRTEWTTQNELPVEIPLPPAYRFHSIFVCPVSKEQSTDQNPAMMMPCGHVIAYESLQRLGKTSKFKCPYCPGESTFKDARKVYL